MQFEFATATRIVFGEGVIAQLPALAQPFGTTALVVTGATIARAETALSGLANTGTSLSYFTLAGEPTLDDVRQGVKLARRCQFVAGFGGGSAIDAAKAIAALAPNSGEPLDYLEVVGQGKALENDPLPFLAIPTTAGTGAEVTRNAVLGSPEHVTKASLRSSLMFAKVALVDPRLTRDLPPAITASTGLDALTQLIEAFVSARANPLTDMMCEDGIRRAVSALPVAFSDPTNAAARTQMSFAALLSGLALANAGLGAVHGFAAPLGALLKAPHGALCAAVLAAATAVNIRALRERARDNPSLLKYRRLARLLTGNEKAAAEDFAPALIRLCKELNTRGLHTFGLTASQIPSLVEKASRATSMKANPIQLSAVELTEIAERSM